MSNDDADEYLGFMTPPQGAVRGLLKVHQNVVKTDAERLAKVHPKSVVLFCINPYFERRKNFSYHSRMSSAVDRGLTTVHCSKLGLNNGTLRHLARRRSKFVNPEQRMSRGSHRLSPLFVVSAREYSNSPERS